MVRSQEKVRGSSTASPADGVDACDVCAPGDEGGVSVVGLLVAKYVCGEGCWPGM
jgi:hypothetical protein